MSISNTIEELLQTNQNKPVLHEITIKLIEEANLNKLIRENSHLRKSILESVDIVAAGIKGDKKRYYYTLHASLFEIYGLHLGHPNKKNVINQFNPLIIEIQQVLEDAWMDYERSRIESIDLDAYKNNFADFFKKMVLTHKATKHVLFDYLENYASFEDFRFFFQQEMTIDSRFDDLVALAQIGMENKIKLELAENYWDELGNGKEELIHTFMFNHLLRELGVTESGYEHDLSRVVSAESLACGNTLSYAVIHRNNSNFALGALGAVEMISPYRFDKIVKGFKRINLSEAAMQYHILHIEIDARHGNGWLRNAIVPTVSEAWQVSEDIYNGAQIRLNTSIDYCDFIYNSYLSAKSLNLPPNQ